MLYVNAALEQMTGYTALELQGANLRLLQGEDHDQEGLRRLREALAKSEPCRVVLRNYRKNGELLWNELTLQPMRDASGTATHFVAFMRDAAGRLKQSDKVQEGVPTWLREDRVTGLSSRLWFQRAAVTGVEHRAARRQAADAGAVRYRRARQLQRHLRPSAGDACLRRIARNIAGVFRRGTDVVGVWKEGCIGVLAVHRDDSGVQGVVDHATAMVKRVAEMHIHHPRAAQRFVTVTAGLATVIPLRAEEDAARVDRQGGGGAARGQARYARDVEPGPGLAAAQPAVAVTMASTPTAGWSR